MNLTVAALVRNEASRYLPQALEAWAEFASEIVVLDDNSSDSTQDLLETFGVEWRSRGYEPHAWGSEHTAREELFNYACEVGFDWLLVLDADMVPANDPRKLLVHDPEGKTPSTILFRLFDLWARGGEGRLWYRDDGFWKGHTNPRAWAISCSAVPQEPEWNERGLHCGHFPRNLEVARVLLAPPEFSLLHYAYLYPEDRERKREQYLDNAKELSTHELAHADSITSPAGISPLPFEVRWSIDKQRCSAVHQ